MTMNFSTPKTDWESYNIGRSPQTAHRFTDTPMLRDAYRFLLKRGLKLLGKHHDGKDFRVMVEREMDYQGVAHTGANWVTCAREIVDQLEQRCDQEPDARMAEAE